MNGYAIDTGFRSRVNTTSASRLQEEHDTRLYARLFFNHRTKGDLSLVSPKGPHISILLHIDRSLL